MTAPESEDTAADANGVITDEELDAKRDEVAQLREELSRLEAERTERENAQANKTTYEALERESERLKALIRAASGEQPDVGLADANPNQEQLEAQAPESAGSPPVGDAATGPVPAPAETTGEGA